MPENTSSFQTAPTIELLYDALVAEGNQDQADLLTGKSKKITMQDFTDFINGKNRKNREVLEERILTMIIQIRLNKRQRLLPWKYTEFFLMEKNTNDPELDNELVFDALIDEGNLDQALLLRGQAKSFTKKDFIDWLNKKISSTEELDDIAESVSAIRTNKDQRLFPWSDEEIAPRIKPIFNGSNTGGGAW